jgi:hypothetical protein
VQLVLATDMKFHFEHTSKFKTKRQSDGFQPGCDREATLTLTRTPTRTPTRIRARTPSQPQP